MVNVITVPTALGPNDPDDGEQGRRLRGLAIAQLEHDNIRPDRFGYKVPSQSGKGVYLVNLEYDDDPYCSCDDFDNRKKPCKHIYAVQAVLNDSVAKAAEAEPKAAAVRITPSAWGPYTTAQVHERELFATLLRELCDTVPQPPQATGRPRLPLSDMLYGMGLKVYSTLSTRRAMTDIREAVAAGRMGREPYFTTPIRYFERPEVTPVLRELIQRSALPLRDVEVDFAQDASGFSTSTYNRWFDHKWGSGSQRKARWVKVHLMCGVKTNIVTAADATATLSADSPYLPDFVRITAQNFRINEVSADKAYSSKRNLQAVADAGGTPFIPFKSRTKPNLGVGEADSLWRKMYLQFTLQEAEFNRHYHKRSNVETVFHMVKAKFGDRIRAKTPTAQVNEALMKVLCHNICVLIRAMHMLGVTPVFEDGLDDWQVE